jgi:hypothetical protein
LVRTSISTGEDRYTLKFYFEEDPRIFLCPPTYKEWIDKQNQVPAAFTEKFVMQKIVIFKQQRTRVKSYYDYVNQGFFCEQIEHLARFEYPQYSIHLDKSERIIKEACIEHKEYQRSKKWVTKSAFNRTLNPYCLVGIYYNLLYLWAEPSSVKKEYTEVAKKNKVSK